MRIGLVETSGHGGLLHYAVQLADGLAGRGHDVELLVPRHHELAHHPGPARRRAVLTPLVARERPVPRNPVLYQLRRARVAARLARSALRAVLECRRGRYDALVLQWDPTLAPVAVAHHVVTASRRHRPTIGYVCHNVRRPEAGDDSPFSVSRQAFAQLTHALRRVDVAFVHGDRSLDEFRSLWPSVPVVVVPHGDEGLLAGARPPSDEERILFFGDWRRNKGLRLLMEAFDDIVAKRPAARLTVAGTPAPADFDDRPLRAWAAQHGDRVQLIPRYIPVDEVPGLFGRARVVVTPYTAGYQSGVIHLAMTVGRAVVTSDVGDLGSAVVHGETGLVVPPSDREALVDALVAVLEDADLAAAMGAAARRRATSSSSWDAVAGRVERALLEVSRHVVDGHVCT